MGAASELLVCPFDCEACPFTDCVAVQFRADGTALISKVHLEPMLEGMDREVRRVAIKRNIYYKKQLPPLISGEDFRFMRTRRGISLQDVHLSTGISKCAIWKWEKGRSTLSERLYRKLMATYDWVPAYKE